MNLLKLSPINKHQQATTIGLLKNINKFMRLASLAVGKDNSLKSPTQLSVPRSGHRHKRVQHALFEMVDSSCKLDPPVSIVPADILSAGFALGIYNPRFAA